MRLDKKLPLLGVRLSFRFILPIALVFAALAWVVVPLADTLNMRWAVLDINMRAQLLADTLQEPIADLLERKERRRLSALFDRAAQDERMYALAFCSLDEEMVVRTSRYPSQLGCNPKLDN